MHLPSSPSSMTISVKVLALVFRMITNRKIATQKLCAPAMKGSSPIVKRSSHMLVLGACASFKHPTDAVATLRWLLLRSSSPIITMNGREGSLSATWRTHKQFKLRLKPAASPRLDLDFAPEVYDRVAPEWPFPTRSCETEACGVALCQVQDSLMYSRNHIMVIR